MITARQRGFSLIELLIGISIATFLIMLAAPNYAVWVADNQIRNATESIVSGLRSAYGEAIKRNELVEFVITPAVGWEIRTVGGAPLLVGQFVEGSSLAQFTRVPAAATTVTFTGLGEVSDTNDDASAVLTQVDVSHSTVGAARALRVLVGGETAAVTSRFKVCDPAIADATSPRFCPI